MDLNLGSNDCEFPDLTTELRAFNDRIWPKAANMELERRIPDPMNSEGPKSTQSRHIADCYSILQKQYRNCCVVPIGVW